MTKEVIDRRADQLRSWVIEQLVQRMDAANLQDIEMRMISGDASFRRYFRIQGFESEAPESVSCPPSLIAVDAPVDTEDCQSFITVARKFLQKGLQVPEVFAVDLSEGWMLLADMGDQLYSQLVDTCQSANDKQLVDGYYRKAIDALVLIQTCHREQLDLPEYTDQLLLQEMNLFRDWFCSKLMYMDLSQQHYELLDDLFRVLVDRATQQLQVCVHRDYHSRNLMVMQDLDSSPGILDFQDAVYGPVSYDLVSLLRDCYIDWPCQQQQEWLDYYMVVATRAGIKLPAESIFWQDFDWMGIQRHLKAVGIFSRLLLRDGKSEYLQHIPLTLNHMYAALVKYPQLQEYAGFIENCITKFAAEYPAALTSRMDQ